MGDIKSHQISVKLTTEEYGWLVRYCDKNDITMAAVMRKALKTYRAALAAKSKQKEQE